MYTAQDKIQMRILVNGLAVGENSYQRDADGDEGQAARGPDEVPDVGVQPERNLRLVGRMVGIVIDQFPAAGDHLRNGRKSDAHARHSAEQAAEYSVFTISHDLACTVKDWLATPI